MNKVVIKMNWDEHQTFKTLLQKLITLNESWKKYITINLAICIVAKTAIKFERKSLIYFKTSRIVFTPEETLAILILNGDNYHLNGNPWEIALMEVLKIEAAKAGLIRPQHP